MAEKHRHRWLSFCVLADHHRPHKVAANSVVRLLVVSIQSVVDVRGEWEPSASSYESCWMRRGSFTFDAQHGPDTDCTSLADPAQNDFGRQATQPLNFGLPDSFKMLH